MTLHGQRCRRPLEIRAKQGARAPCKTEVVAKTEVARLAEAGHWAASPRVAVANPGAVVVGAENPVVVVAAVAAELQLPERMSVALDWLR